MLGGHRSQAGVGAWRDAAIAGTGIDSKIASTATVARQVLPLLGGRAPNTVAERSALYAAADAALRQRQSDTSLCPRFFGAAHRVTQRLGVGWVDLITARPSQRALARVAARAARWAGYLGPDSCRAVSRPAAQLLQQLNAHLWLFNLNFMHRLLHDRVRLFDPISGAELRYLPGLSPGLGFDFWLVVREQLEIEAWLQTREVVPGGELDRLITAWEHARRRLATGAAIQRLGLRRSAHIQHLIKVDLLLSAAQRRLPAAAIRFSALDWRTAIGCAHVYALHPQSDVTGFLAGLEALTAAGAPLDFSPAAPVSPAALTLAP